MASTPMRSAIAAKATPFARLKLSRLGANANISYFTSILGQPVLTMQHSEELTEHVFIDKLYYVQAIVTESGTVKFYTVTVRDKRLRCTVPLPNEGRYTFDAPSVKIRLGVTRSESSGNHPLEAELCYRVTRSAPGMVYRDLLLRQSDELSNPHFIME